MSTLAKLFQKLADAAAADDLTTFKKDAEILFLQLETRYPTLLEEDDTDFMDAYAQIVDYHSSGAFTIEKDEAVALIGSVAFREELGEDPGSIPGAGTYT